MALQTEALVEVMRGGRVESEHRGAIAVVDANGVLIAHSGDVGLISYLRSSAKPFQLLPLVESGAADRLGFTDAELAVIAGSHSGEPRHVAAVQSILHKIGLGEDALQCGIHVPFSADSSPCKENPGIPDKTVIRPDVIAGVVIHQLGLACPHRFGRADSRRRGPGSAVRRGGDGRGQHEAGAGEQTVCHAGFLLGVECGPAQS